MDTGDGPFLSTVAGESAFFRALCDARPVGVHREFHMMAVAAHIQSATGTYVTVDELWEKFKECYDQEILESYEKPGYQSTGSTSSSSSDDEKAMDVDDEHVPKARRKSKDRPKPGDDLENHPYFRKEFELPAGPGWAPLPSTSGRRDSGGTTMTTTTTAQAAQGHKRKESTATGRTTRASAKTVEKAASESDSELTTDEGGDADAEGEVDAEGEDAEEGDEDAEADEERDARSTRSTRAETKSVGDAEEQAGATRRSTRTRMAPKELPPIKGATKKKRGK